MAAIHGSSRIRDIGGEGSITGPQGPIGITAGPTGSTGGTYGGGWSAGDHLGFAWYGASGNTGTIGVGIDSVSSTSVHEIGGGTFDLILTDDSSMSVTGATGATGDGSSENHNFFTVTNVHDGATVGQIAFNVVGAGSWDSSTGTSDYGATAYFRGITTSGRDISVAAGSTHDTIILRGATYDYGIIGNTGELVYIFSTTDNGASAHGALNTFWEGGTAGLTGHLQARFAVIRETQGSNNLQPAESVVNTTPVGTTLGSTGEIVPFTYMNTLGDYAKIYSGFHMGMSGATEVTYKFFGKGSTAAKHDTEYKFQDFGSCCYCKDNIVEGETDYPGCIDYVSSNYCSDVGGIFDTQTCLARPEGPDCYSEGACCVNGTCAETSLTKCRNIYGGFYVQGMSCTTVESLGGCPEPCEPTGACCIEGGCFEMSGYQCSFEPNGIFITGGACDPNQENFVNCCTEAVYGACCVDEKCFETTPAICRTLRAVDGSPGLFWGVGSRCGGPSRMDGGGWYDNPANCKNDGKDCAAYAPFNCTYSIEQGGVLWEGTTGGVDVSGNCLGCTSGYCPPPCTPCIGWSQLVSGDEEDGNVCGDPRKEDMCPCPCGSCAPSRETSYLGCLGTCCKHDPDGWSCEQSTRMECAGFNGDVSANYNILRWSGCNDEVEMCCDDQDCVLGQSEPLCSDILTSCQHQDPTTSPDVMIVVDSSLPMYLHADKIKNALISLVDMFDPSLTKIGFTDSRLANHTRVNTPLTFNHAIVKEGINSMTLGDDVLHHPLKLAYDDIKINAQSNPNNPSGADHRVVVIVLSTGNLRSTEEWDAIFKPCDDTGGNCGSLADLNSINNLSIYSVAINAQGVGETNMITLAYSDDYYINNDFDDLNINLGRLGNRLTCGGEDVTSTFERQTCGSIILSDNSCWECCCDHDGTGLDGSGSFGGNAGNGITDPLDWNCCYNSGSDDSWHHCSTDDEVLGEPRMVSCCWWLEEYGDPICKTVGRSCAWPGGGGEAAHPWLHSKDMCMSVLHGTTVFAGGDASECANTDADACCGIGSCSEYEPEPGCCCFHDDWSLPESLSWMENVEDWRIPNAGDCIVQSYGEHFAHQMNEIRCEYFGGCWISNGDCSGGVLGGECGANNSTIDPCNTPFCIPDGNCT